MPSIEKLFCVKAKPNFYQESPEYTKYFLDEMKAFDYMDEILNRIWHIPIMVIIEEGLAIVENMNDTNVYSLSCNPI
jgi:predicted alpha/beta superfamily hydrolase